MKMISVCHQGIMIEDDCLDELASFMYALMH